MQSIGGREVFGAITLWYIALEHYIQLIYQFSQDNKHPNVEEESDERPPPMDKQFKRIYNNFFNCSIDSNPTGASIAPCLTDFRKYRNNLLHGVHDSTNNNSKYAVMKFSTPIEYTNELDLMKCIKVSVDAMVFYSNIIQGLDILPQVQVGVDHKRIDELYNNLLLPCFTEILDKINLDTRFNLNKLRLKGIACDKKINLDIHPLVCGKNPIQTEHGQKHEYSSLIYNKMQKLQTNEEVRVPNMYAAKKLK